MKYSIFMLCISLTGCVKLSYEQVEAKTKYCEDRHLTPVSLLDKISNVPYGVICKDAGGVTYEVPRNIGG